MKIVIIKYNAGNIQSVDFALQRLGVKAEITDDPEAIRKADKVIFPGVGEASTTMEYLRKTGLDKLICSLKQPVLGICLGMQLMCSSSEEGNADGLCIFPVEVKAFLPKSGFKIPHMGWNTLQMQKAELFAGITESDWFYFVHSFYAESNENSVANCDYILPFAAALQKDNFYGVQFHPEKSGVAGEKLLQNFLKL